MPERGVQNRGEEMLYLCLSSKVRSFCFHPLFRYLPVVKPIQAVTVIKNYIIKLQVRGQEDKKQTRRKIGDG